MIKISIHTISLLLSVFTLSLAFILFESGGMIKGKLATYIAFLLHDYQIERNENESIACGTQVLMGG